MKTKITVTLDEYDADVFEKAVRIVSKLRGEADETQASHRSFSTPLDY